MDRGRWGLDRLNETVDVWTLKDRILNRPVGPANPLLIQRTLLFHHSINLREGLQSHDVNGYLLNNPPVVPPTQKGQRSKESA